MEQYPDRGLAGSSTGTSKANSIPPNPSSRHVTSQPQLPGPSRVIGDSTSATRESVGQGLAQELPSVESLALPLRVHYNTLLPIFRLPQELLSKIFHICASDNRHHSNPPRAGDLGWIKLTHVCSSWRRVARADRMLWTRISGGLSESWVNAMLDRAKSAPLSIENPNIQGQFLYSMLETHLHHTKLLSLSLSAEDMLDAVNAISSTAPILETLILHVSPPTQYLPTISLKNTSALRTLVLDGVTLDWEVAIPHLETLHIMPASFRKVDSKSLPSTYDLSTLISASASSLRHLKLHGCLPDLSAPDAPFPPISLPNLATLSLAGTKRQCGTIINMLSISPICNLEIECTVRETPYTDFTPVVSSISGFLKHGESIGPLVDLSIEMAEGHIAIIEGSRGPQCLGFLLSIDFLGAPSEDIHSVFRNLPLHDVDFLSVSPEDGEDPGWDWRELARVCPRVTKLRVAARATWPEWWMEIFGVLASQLLDADRPRGGIDDCINHTPALPFPFLRRLELTSVSDSSDSSDDEDGASYDDYIAGLRQMLQTRRDQGFGIAELAVSKSFRDLDLDIDGLRELVSMVEVDMRLDDD